VSGGISDRELDAGIARILGMLDQIATDADAGKSDDGVARHWSTAALVTLGLLLGAQNMASAHAAGVAAVRARATAMGRKLVVDERDQPSGGPA
jgi:hypothetical protein